MDHKDIRQLAELMKELELTVLEVSEGNSVVRMERAGGQASAPAFLPAHEQSEQAAPPVDCGKDLHTITAPMVGVFYAAPSPEMKPYVSVGDSIRAGDVLCVIEAMKMMNEITAEVDGIVAEICVGNKQVVDYGHPLFRIRREKPTA